MRRSIAAVAVVSGSLAGCLSMQNNPTLDAMHSAAGSRHPFVEGYIEYPGPQEKWSGPVSFVLHLSARDPGQALVSVTPSVFLPRKARTEQEIQAGRQPASQVTISSDAAREELQQLADAMEARDSQFAGCLYPVKAKLVRADGSLLERQGCRSKEGWPRMASEVVSRALSGRAPATALPAAAAPVAAAQPVAAPARLVPAEPAGQAQHAGAKLLEAPAAIPVPQAKAAPEKH